jgi:hypothetical protein
METKGDNIYVNIKELPQLDEVQPGDLIIIETDTGTNTIDFSNFILPPENVTFYGEITQLQEDVATINTELSTATTNFTTSANNLITELGTAVNNVTTQVAQFSSTYFNQLITGMVTFDGTLTDNTEGINCTAVRNAVGNYSVVFNGNINAATVSSNADKTRLDSVQGNVCVFTTMSASTTTTTNQLSTAVTGQVIYTPADTNFISVIGA